VLAVTWLWLLILAPVAAASLLAWFLDSSEDCTLCGCDAEVHRHDRAGTDCGRCGRGRCPAFTARIVWRKS
jgi:hypothetical protein